MEVECNRYRCEQVDRAERSSSLSRSGVDWHPVVLSQRVELNFQVQTQPRQRLELEDILFARRPHMTRCNAKVRHEVESARWIVLP